MINLKLITAEVNLGLSQLRSRYMRAYVPVRVWFVKCNAFSHRTVPLQCLTARSPRTQMRSRTGETKGETEGVPRRLHREYMSSYKV